MSANASINFPTTYEESITQFRDQLSEIKRRWPGAILDSKQISKAEDVKIYWIRADALTSPEKILILSTGLHGVEGFVGAAMRSLFIQEFLERFDPNITGILLVNNINPWGMKNKRRVNENNVDLNRNFMEDAGEFQENFNPSYQQFDATLNPRRPLGSSWLETGSLLFQVLINLFRFGFKGLRGAVLLGQSSNPQGLYFSGREYQVEVSLMRDLIKDAFQRYPAVTLIDMHTGYGPRYQMSIVNSPNEKRSPEELKLSFRYPLIVQADPDQFYSMKGDMIDWIYRYQQAHHADSSYYGTAFEFGVYGDGIPNEIKSLRTMIFENQVYHHGAESDRLASWVREEIVNMYFPQEEEWREKALGDCRQGFAGVLASRGFLG